ncbi:DUF1648 domain-containing protein [uncultured Clostridium sp.]|uniref:DUF1648 domain-containing protein n=1 Tax=uncultured Clostridium sp. TaxID=59620 RepID=UPI0027DD1F35|nr:DUF1648 domain-containing protein [uncultured Clostridium sp.]
MIKGKEKSFCKKINVIIDVISAILMIIMIAGTFLIWKNAPDIVPTHFNFKGEVDNYGSKDTIFLLLIIAAVCYGGMAVLSKYPQIYNYCVEITSRNKEKQYLMAQTFIKLLNLETVIILLYIQLKSGTMMINGSENLSIVFLPITLIVLTATIVIYIWQSRKNK